MKQKKDIQEIIAQRKKNKCKIALYVLYLIAIAALLLFINFSTFFLSQEDLVGTYTGQYVGFSREIQKEHKIKNGIYNDGTHRLDLKEDGTYTYLYRSISGEEIKYPGTWEYRKHTSDKVLILFGQTEKDLILRGYTIVPGKHDPNSFNHINVKKKGKGRFLLPINPEVLFWFVKESGQTKRPGN